MKTLTPALQNLVRILNDLQVHSGNDLGKALNISRNAVWKHINQLIKYGIAIESVQSTGYRLQAPVVLLNEAEIRQALKDPNVLLCLCASISSTMDHVKTLAATERLQFCLAEHQSKGRGRFGRQWVAPFAANILMSARFVLPEDISHWGGLSLCVGLAVLCALQDFGIEDLTCKWPNDILYRGKKLGGVLIEMYGEAHSNTEAIIGIGVNVNMPQAMLDPIDRPTTSLEAILGQPQDRNQIAALIIHNLCEYLQRFHSQGFSDFIATWNRHDALYQQAITLNIGNNQITGIASGIDASGHLLLQLPSGELKAYSAGEASLSKQ